MRRLRAVRLGLPGRRDLRRGRRQHRRASAFSPGERYGRVYQINYLRCIFCGLCIEACPTRALTMTNEYELADDSRADLIFTKEQLLAPLQAGMVAAAAPDGRRALEERDYYQGKVTAAAAGQRPGSSARGPAATAARAATPVAGGRTVAPTAPPAAPTEGVHR